MALNTYNSPYIDDPYYTRYDTLDGILQQQQAQQQQAAQQQGGIGNTIGGAAGQYAGKKAGQYALDQLGSSGASEIGSSGLPSGSLPGDYLSGMQNIPSPQVGPTLQNAQGLENVGSSWTSAPANGSIGQIGGGLAAAKGTYDTIKGFQQGGEGMRSGMTTAGGGVGMMVAGPLGAAVGAGVGNIAGYGLQGKGIKNDVALLAALGPTALLAKKFGLLTPHKTTRQVAQENTKNLLNTGKDDQTWQNYVQGMRSQYNAPPPDPSKPFAGKYASWDEYQKAGLDAADLTGVVGNLKAYGPQYAGLSFDQQKALTQKNIDAGNYSSSKGEVNINDEAKAKSFLDELLKAQKK